MSANAVACFEACAGSDGDSAVIAIAERADLRVMECFIEFPRRNNSRLKDDLCCYLHHPAATCRSNAPECRTCERIVRCEEVGMIKRIESFPSEFQALVFMK